MTDKERGFYEFIVRPPGQIGNKMYRAELTPDYSSFDGVSAETYPFGEGETVFSAIKNLCERLDNE